MTEDPQTIKELLYDFYMRKRRSMIADLAAVEDLLGLPRSIPSRKDRKKEIQPDRLKGRKDE